MAYYLVSAKPKPDRLPDLLKNPQETGIEPATSSLGN